jgi:hypothetical protein
MTLAARVGVQGTPIDAAQLRHCLEIGWSIGLSRLEHNGPLSRFETNPALDRFRPGVFDLPRIAHVSGLTGSQEESDGIRTPDLSVLECGPDAEDRRKHFLFPLARRGAVQDMEFKTWVTLVSFERSVAGRAIAVRKKAVTETSKCCCFMALNMHNGR